MQDLSNSSNRRLATSAAWLIVFMVLLIIAARAIGGDDVELQYAEKCESHGLHYWNTGAKPHCEGDDGKIYQLDKLS